MTVLDRASSQEECYLRALMDSLPLSIYFKDRESRFTRINREQAKRLGLRSPEDAVGKTDHDYFGEEHAAQALADEREIIQSGRPFIEKVERETWPDQSVTWAVSTKMALTDQTGRIIGTFGISRDVTEARKSEDASRFLASLVEASDDAIIGVNHFGRIVTWNRGAAALYGYTAEDVIGKMDLSVLSLNHADEAAQILEEIRQGERILHLETLHLSKQGIRTPVSMTVSPIKNEQGAVTGAVVVAQDISGRKQLEVDLRQAQKLETIGQLAAGIAHEINTPVQYVGDNIQFAASAIASIGGLVRRYRALAAASPRTDNGSGAELEDLRQAEAAADLDYLLDELPKAIEQSDEGVKRVANIVRAMKEFSHPGSSEKELADLNHAIENTLVVCRHEWKYVADVETKLDPALPPVLCLEGEINQVVLSLVVNAAHAIHAAKKSGGLIKVSTREHGGHVEIRVEDNGTGIPESYQQRIFTPFFTTKEVGKGTGQGLCLARTVVVKKHGGTLTFETSEGKGTTFIVRLPLNRP